MKLLFLLLIIVFASAISEQEGGEVLSANDMQSLFGQGTLADLVGKALVQKEFQADDNTGAQDGMAEALAAAIVNKKKAYRSLSGAVHDPIVGNIVDALNKAEEGGSDLLAQSTSELVAQGGQDHLIDLLASAIIQAENAQASGAPSDSSEDNTGTTVPPPPDGPGSEDSSVPELEPEKILAQAQAKEAKATRLTSWIEASERALKKTEEEQQKVKEIMNKLNEEIVKLEKERLDIYKKVRKDILSKKMSEAKLKESIIEKDIEKLNKLAGKMEAKKIESAKIKHQADITLFTLAGTKPSSSEEASESQSQSTPSGSASTPSESESVPSGSEGSIPGSGSVPTPPNPSGSVSTSSVSTPVA